MLAATGFSTKDVEIAKRDRQIAEMQADVARIQKAADAVADRVEARQEFLASLLDGKSDPVQLAALMPGTAEQASVQGRYSAAVTPPTEIEDKQLAFVGQIGRAPVCTPVTNAQPVYRLLLAE